MFPLIERARQQGDRLALIAPEGTVTYRQLLETSACAAATLLAGADDLRETRVALLTPPGLSYVAWQWGIWRAGGIVVPLSVSHPPPELDYVIGDCAASIVVGHPDFEARVRPVADARGLRFLSEVAPNVRKVLPDISPDRRAMILYTSGTTSKPKGVVTTHANLQAQIESLVTAWEWSADDHLLHVLPLHHLHGILNALLCPLWAGATCEILPAFDADQVWKRLGSGAVTVFMAVPTVYNKLIAAAGEQPRPLPDVRLMVCGSAALPVSTLERWRQLTGHTLLERYGMTETGMILSNPLHGERRPGFVGTPLPGIEVRLEGEPGEIWVRGPGVFREYWQRPEATAQAFQDGWFRTGDIAVFEDGMYRMLGRSSVDIIKTGGYKVSALEIEEVLRTHPGIQECAGVALPDETWGERVCAAVILKSGATLSFDDLRAWAKERLATYKVPRQLVVVDSFPRNAMGKVVKPELARLITGRRQT